MNQSKSDMTTVECGFTQGSWLVPLLFKIYINSISNLDLTDRLHMFSDNVWLIVGSKYGTRYFYDFWVCSP